MFAQIKTFVFHISQFLLVLLSDMDDSMNSAHSVSAMDMDISPASSPRLPLNPITPNPYLINTFQYQQELLANILLNQPNINDYSIRKQTHIQDDDFDVNSKSTCLYSTVLTENNDENKSPPIIPEETNQIRQRIISESIPTATIVEPTLIKKKSSRSFSKILLFIPIVLSIIYFLIQYMNKSIIIPRSSNWQNASEYLTQNLIGQDQGLNELNDTMKKHKNFSIILIEVIINFNTYFKINKFILLGFNWYWKILFSIIT